MRRDASSQGDLMGDPATLAFGTHPVCGGDRTLRSIEPGRERGLAALDGALELLKRSQLIDPSDVAAAQRRVGDHTTRSTQRHCRAIAEHGQ